MVPPAFSKPLDAARMFAYGALGLLLTGGALVATRSAAVLDLYTGGRYVTIDSGSLLVFTALGFAICGAIYYAFPRLTEKNLRKGLGTLHFWLSLAGVLLGLAYLQIISRVQNAGGGGEAAAGFAPGVGQQIVSWFLLVGSLVFFAGQALFVVNLVWSSFRPSKAASLKDGSPR